MFIHHVLDAWHEASIILSNVSYSFYVHIAGNLTDGQRLSNIFKFTKSRRAGM